MSINLCSTICYHCGLDLRRYFGNFPIDTEGMLTAEGYWPEHILIGQEGDWGAPRGHDDDEVRWKQLECPLCHVLYAGWYFVETCVFSGVMELKLFDLSYFHARNDEPVDADIAGAIHWTAESLHAHTMLKTT